MNNWKYIFIVVTFLSCESTKSPEVDVYEIRNIGILNTTEYTLGKVLKVNDEAEWYKFGDRKILISTKAHVKAGIDLKKIKKDDIQVEGKQITIILPAPEITVFEMNPADIRTEMTDVNGFRMSFTQEEKNEILRLGERQIKTELKTLNIEQRASMNAEDFISDFYKRLGFEKVIIGFKPDNPETK